MSTTNNELILSTASAPTKFSFKNAKLNELSGKIAAQTDAMNKLYNDTKQRAEAINSALAPIFGELLVSKCYTDDGFKSVADYAEQTFGIGKSMAYMLARVGKEFYNEGAELTAKAREALTVSKLGELTGVDRIAISKAIDAGELSSESSLQDCRNFAASHRKAGKEKVVQMYDLYPVPHKSGDKPIAVNVVKDDFILAVLDSKGKLDVHPSNLAITGVKFEGDKASAAQHFVVYAVSGALLGYSEVFEYRPHVNAATGKKSKREPFDLASYIKSLSPEERDALAAMVKGE